MEITYGVCVEQRKDTPMVFPLVALAAPLVTKALVGAAVNAGTKLVEQQAQKAFTNVLNNLDNQRNV